MKKATYLLVQSHLACAHGCCRQEPVLVDSSVPVHRQCLCSLQGMRGHGQCEQHHGTVLLNVSTSHQNQTALQVPCTTINRSLWLLNMVFMSTYKYTEVKSIDSERK